LSGARPNRRIERGIGFATLGRNRWMLSSSGLGWAGHGYRAWLLDTDRNSCTLPVAVREARAAHPLSHRAGQFGVFYFFRFFYFFLFASYFLSFFDFLFFLFLQFVNDFNKCSCFAKKLFMIFEICLCLFKKINHEFNFWFINFENCS
jgi:hypothetical protein